MSNSTPTTRRWLAARAALIAASTAFCVLVPRAALAQSSGFEIRGPIDDVPLIKDVLPGFNTTVVPRSEPSAPKPEEAETGQVTFEALLTEDGQRITEDVVWRIFQRGAGLSSQPVLLQTRAEPVPTLNLPAGTYYVNAAFGRANLTRRVTVLARGTLREQFVLNAGGFRAAVEIEGGGQPMAQNVSINIYSDESDQSGERQKIVSGARPGQIIRLNSGLYHVESRIGQANASVRSEVSVEAGKLTEAKIRHQAATITFKLVSKPGGEAIAGTNWVILGRGGNVVQEAMGALPRHVLAPGTYTVNATIGGQSYRRDFEVVSGRNTDVEVLTE